MDSWQKVAVAGMATMLWIVALIAFNADNPLVIGGSFVVSATWLWWLLRDA